MRLTGNIVASMKMNIPLGEEISKNKSLTYSGSAKINAASVYMLKDKVDITDIKGEILFTEKKQGHPDQRNRYNHRKKHSGGRWR